MEINLPLSFTVVESNMFLFSIVVAKSNVSVLQW